MGEKIPLKGGANHLYKRNTKKSKSGIEYINKNLSKSINKQRKKIWKAFEKTCIDFVSNPNKNSNKILLVKGSIQGIGKSTTFAKVMCEYCDKHDKRFFWLTETHDNLDDTFRRNIYVKDYNIPILKGKQVQQDVE